MKTFKFPRGQLDDGVMRACGSHTTCTPNLLKSIIIPPPAESANIIPLSVPNLALSSCSCTRSMRPKSNEPIWRVFAPTSTVYIRMLHYFYVHFFLPFPYGKVCSAIRYDLKVWRDETLSARVLRTDYNTVIYAAEGGGDAHACSPLYLEYFCTHETK